MAAKKTFFWFFPLTIKNINLCFRFSNFLSFSIIFGNADRSRVVFNNMFTFFCSSQDFASLFQETQNLTKKIFWNILTSHPTLAQFLQAFSTWKVAETMKNSQLNCYSVKLSAKKVLREVFSTSSTSKKQQFLIFLRNILRVIFFTVFLRLKIFSYLMWSYNLLFIPLNFYSFKR